MTARALAATALLALSLVADPGRAETARVLLIPAGSGDPLTANLLDELVALGVAVEVVAGAPGDLTELARARSAQAALRVDRSKHAVELWAAGSPDVAWVEARPDEPGGEAAGLALRAVELLRGRLLHVPAPPPAPAAAPPAPRARAARAARALGAGAEPGRRSRIALYVGPSVVLQPGSAISPAGAAMGGVRWRLTDRLDGELVTVVTVVPGAIDAPTGRARLSTAVVGAGASLDLLDRRLPVAMHTGAGIGAGFLSYYGQPSDGGVRGRDGTIPYGLPFVRWDIGWRVYPPLTLRADVLAGIAAPRPVIRLVGRADVPFGQPLLGLGLQLEVVIR